MFLISLRGDLKVTGPLQLHGQPRSFTLNQMPPVRTMKRVFWGLTGDPWASSMALVLCWDDSGAGQQGLGTDAWAVLSTTALPSLSFLLMMVFPQQRWRSEQTGMPSDTTFSF